MITPAPEPRDGPHRRTGLFAAAPGSGNVRQLRTVAGAAASIAPEQTPAQMLADVRLEESRCPRLREWLAGAGCLLEEEELCAAVWAQLKRRVSVISRGEVRLYMLSIPSVLLNAPSVDALTAVGGFVSVLPENARVVIVSPGLDAPHCAYERLFDTWSTAQITHWVPWRRLVDLESEDEPAQELGRVLHLDDLLSPLGRDGNVVALARDGGGSGGNGGNGTRSLTDTDKQRIARVLAELATIELTDPQAYLNGIVDRLQLPQTTRESLYAFSGDVSADAKKLVSYLAGRGRYPADHELHACHFVGVLIHRMVESFSDDRSEHLIEIATKCKLLDDAWTATLGRIHDE